MDLCIIPISTEDANFHASLAQIGPFLVLFDCGWQEALDVNDFNALTPYLHRVDVVLLSRATMQHLGGYPYLVQHLNKDAVVLCTEPVRHMGELACLSLVEELEKYKNVEVLDTECILRAFADKRLKCLKYTESFHLAACQDSIGETSLKITPYQAGGSLGAAFWIIDVGSAQMVYCADFSLRDTRHVGGMDFERLMASSDLKTPSIFLTSLVPVRTDVPHLGQSRTPATATMQNTVGTAAQVCLTCAEAFFLERTLETLREGGSVIVPIDVTGAVFDLLFLLDEAWGADSSISEKFPLCWVSCLNDILLDQIKTRLEFMSKRVQRLFEERPEKKSPFMLSNVRMYSSIDDMHLHVVPEQPKIVLATLPSLENGDVRELMFLMAHDPLNLLWLTQNWYPEGSLGARVFQDFVLHKYSEKEYEVIQHLKLPWTETQLRAYYEEKLAEERKDRIKMEDNDKMDIAGYAEYAEEAGDIERTGKTSAIAHHPRIAETFFEPPGWIAKTFIHADSRKDIDDYGQVLGKKEMAAWRTANVDEKEEEIVTREAHTAAVLDSVKQEMSYDKSWLHDLRIRYREPMRCEARKKIIRVACKVLFCPLNTHDHRDTRTLITKMRPQHVVALPTTAPCEFETFASTGIIINLLATPLAFPWRSLKRKSVFSTSLWEKVSFQKLPDGTRIATVTAVSCGNDSYDTFDTFDGNVHADTLLLSMPKLSTIRASLKDAMPHTRISFQQDPSGTRLLDLNGKVRLGVEGKAVKLEGALSEEYYHARAALYDNCVAL
eukprot:GEMP01013722.1.p1 GENE.GEMP01013722.1~~GEMP01013722.1.p1  ORF type:complete len:779 (+),score=165.84 GEMP01013722.1:195-2531(+)